jgi:probable phosphoglycerate mutase
LAEDGIVTTFVVIRHGETEWNKIGRQQGHLDSPLTDLGRRQARAAASGLQGFRFDAFYSSDLGRARETARIISPVIGLGFESEARLRERHLGVLQGLTMAEFAEKYPEEEARFRTGGPDYRLADGESVRDRFERNTAGLEALARRHPGALILIVTHGGVLASFMHKALGLTLGAPRSFSLLNAAVNVFSIADTVRWRLETWGETGHLRAAGLASLDDF